MTELGKQVHIIHPKITRKSIVDSQPLMLSDKMLNRNRHYWFTSSVGGLRVRMSTADGTMKSHLNKPSDRAL